MSLLSAAKAAVAESDVKLDSPAALMQVHLSPAVMLLRKLARSRTVEHVHAPMQRQLRQILTNACCRRFCCVRCSPETAARSVSKRASVEAPRCRAAARVGTDDYVP